MQKVIAKICLENIRKNATAFKAHSGAKLCAVVKADAYGHGAEEVVLALSEIADCFAVALIEEGIAIRGAACGKDILVFTPPVDKEECYALVKNGFIISVPNLYTAKLCVEVCKQYGLRGRVHLKVNTGMNRYGMNPSMLGRVCKLLQAAPAVCVEGIYSHLYTCDEKISEKQKRLFLQMQAICKRYFPSVVAHLGATYGAAMGRRYAFDMVRVGLGLYGYSPVQTPFPVYPAMQVFARVVEKRKYAFGGVGYGEKQFKRGEKITLSRVGYADGFLRSKNGLIDGEKEVNSLCMDVRICAGAKMRGKYLPVLLNAEETAKKAGTIPYEVLCAATRRAERIYES